MPIRLLDAAPSDFARMDAPTLKASIAAADGRTLAAEVICTAAPPVDGVSHGELAAALGADLIVLDRYDPLRPAIAGTPEAICASETPLTAYKRLLGRPLGINLIVTADDAGAELGGRRATPEHVALTAAQGADCVFLYARPLMGGTFERQVEAARQINAAHERQLLLVGVPTFSAPPPRDAAGVSAYCDSARRLIDAGCAGVGLPMPGSKAGWTVEAASAAVDAVRAAGGLSWLLVTGSIEGAPEPVMTALALLAKQIGADAVRLDEAGLSGMPSPENILAFSLAFRGRAHTFRRMATGRR